MRNASHSGRVRDASFAEALPDGSLDGLCGDAARRAGGDGTVSFIDGGSQSEVAV
jgi:hypothetical protein